MGLVYSVFNLPNPTTYRVDARMPIGHLSTTRPVSHPGTRSPLSTPFILLAPWLILLAPRIHYQYRYFEEYGYNVSVETYWIEPQSTYDDESVGGHDNDTIDSEYWLGQWGARRGCGDGGAGSQSHYLGDCSH